VQISTGDKKELYAIRNYSLRCFNHLAVSLWKTFEIFEARERLVSGLTQERALYANPLMRLQQGVGGVKLKQQLNLGSFVASDAKVSCNPGNVLHEAQSCKIASCFYSAGISIENQSLKGSGAADSPVKSSPRLDRPKVQSR
jgi:hypothetical protein